MPIQVECPECAKEYRVPDKAAGRRIRCKECDGPISIPQPKRQTSPPKRRRPVEHNEFDDEDDDDDFDERPQRRRRRPADDYDEEYDERPRRRRPAYDDDDDFDERPQRRRSKQAKKSGGGFRWGPLVALAGIPLLFIGVVVGSFLGGNEMGMYLGIALMNIAFGVSAAISAVQKGHSIGVGIPLGFLALLGLLIVAFLPDNSKAPTKKKRRRR